MATKGRVRFFKKVLPRGLTGLEAGKLMLREGLGRRKGQSISRTERWMPSRRGSRMART